MNNTTLKKILETTAAIAVFGLSAAGPALAQTTPSYASGTTDETITGTISAVNGPYDLSVRDARGFIDHVTLHQGTIINPTGLSLAPGMSVTIQGTNAGQAFAANEIDTPYQTLAAVPIYPGYGYPAYYPYYGFGPAYGVGLRFGRGFGFGFRG